MEKEKEPDTSNWFTRDKVAQVAGIGISTVVAHEKHGRLNPRRVYRRDTRGADRPTLVYDPMEVLKLPRRERVLARSPGETTARAFELFRDGRTLEDVVIELRETFDLIRELHEQWLDASGAAHVISPMAWEALARLVGPFASVTDLLAQLEERLKP
jgi:hypothetical protein